MYAWWWCHQEVTAILILRVWPVFDTIYLYLLRIHVNAPTICHHK